MLGELSCILHIASMNISCRLSGFETKKLESVNGLWTHTHTRARLRTGTNTAIVMHTIQ